MKLEQINFIVKEEEYEGHKYMSLYIVLNKVEYLIGTLKGKDFKYIKSISKGGK